MKTVLGVPVPNFAELQQEEIFEQAIKCFQATEGKYAFFETSNEGKTIMCAAVDWILYHLNNSTEKDKSKILYMCGSDYECSKRIEEFKTTSYAAHVPMILLDSSEKMAAVFMNDLCEEKNCAPQIIFTTHTFFLQEVLSSSSVYPPKEKEKQFTLKDTLVVIDDGHVLEQACINVSSRALSICKVEKSCKRLDTICQHDSNIEKLRDLMKKFKSLYRSIAACNGGDFIVTFKGHEIKSMFNPYYDKFVNEFKLIDISDTDMEIMQFISHISQFQEKETFKEVFQMYIVEEIKGEHHHALECKRGCKTYEIACLDPSLVMEKIVKMDPHSLIINSTTITPFNPLMVELGLSEAKQFIFPPAIEDFKIFARIVTCGAGGYYLNSDEFIRKDADYRTSLGKTIVEISALTPHGKGLMILFASNELMMDCKLQWKTYLAKGNSGTLWKSLCEYRDTFTVHADSVETKEEDEVKFSHLHKRLRKSREESGKGSCFMTVFKGQVYEDLTSIQPDDRRVVVMVGVPVLPMTDPKIRLKRDFHNSQIQNKKATSMSGAQYLTREAYKVVRRLIDRQIDVMDSYGVLVMCDMMYDYKQLSTWIQDKILVEKRFTEFLSEIKNFFECIDQRVEWFNVRLDPQPGTQFGKVLPWEVFKVRAEHRKFFKKNQGLEAHIKWLQENLASLSKEKSELEKSISVLKLKEPEAVDQTGGADDHIGNNSQQAEAEIVEVADVNMVSTTPVLPSPRKRPYPEAEEKCNE